MKNTVSLQKNSRFRLIYQRGKSIANKTLVLYIFKNDEKINRLGITVSKKVGKSVVRNKVRRRIKESFRLIEQKLKIGYDFVFIARNVANDKNFKEIDSSVRHLIKKHELFDVERDIL